jgi:hypothetical protein
VADERFENACAAIVCDVLGGGARWQRRDLPGARQMRNFDIVFADGRFEALEICAFTDPEGRGSSRGAHWERHVAVRAAHPKLVGVGSA